MIQFRKKGGRYHPYKKGEKNLGSAKNNRAVHMYGHASSNHDELY